MAEPTNNVTPTQVRMARSYCGITAAQLARRAGVGVMTIKRFESGTPIADESLARIRSALEEAGIEFIWGGVPSVGGPAVVLPITPATPPKGKPRR